MIKTRRMGLMLAVFIILIPNILFAATVNLPKTGQTDIYATGDDGNLQAGVAWPSPRFTDNGDGTVTDKLTGLMWLQNANLFGNRGEWEDAFYNLWRMNVGQVINYGYTDWRLPNVHELESLVNVGVSSPAAWLNSQGFINVQSSMWFYWSSTMYVSSWGNLAWGVKMFDGEIHQLPMSGTGNGNNYVWPVRSGQHNNPDPDYPANLWKTGQTGVYATGDDGHLQMGVTWPSPRFTDNGDGTVTDNLTGLMWLKDTSCIATRYPDFDDIANRGDGEVTWQYAIDFVAGINSGTYSNCGAAHNDWRLPNRKELRSLIDYYKYSPALPSGHPFTGRTWSFWTSTTNILSTDTAWYVNTKDGTVKAELKQGGAATSFFGGVWPVRSPGISSCTYSISPASKSFTSDGSTGSVSVTAADSCDWTASSNTSWLTITSGGSGSGNGTVNYSVSANTSAGSRTGTMTIEGKIFTVIQTGVGASPVPDVKANVSDGPVEIGTGDTLSVSIILTAGSSLGLDCDWWMAVSTSSGWYYFDVGTMNWVYAGDSYTDLSSTFQGPLFDLSTFEVLNMSGLSEGSYTFYFAIDTNRNGSLSMDQIYYDSVVVNIIP